MNEQMGLAKAGGLVSRNRPERQLSVQLVKNGYVISPSWPGQTAIAKTLNEMLDEVRNFFEDNPDAE